MSVLLVFTYVKATWEFIITEHEILLPDNSHKGDNGSHEIYVVTTEMRIFILTFLTVYQGLKSQILYWTIVAVMGKGASRKEGSECSTFYRNRM